MTFDTTVLAPPPALPRPEYPRPQFRRRDWLNLNGEWEFAFDDSDQGAQDRWQEGRAFGARILVPFPYQSTLSGLDDQSIHEIVWYARDFQIPDEWRGQDLLLHFGAVDYQATVWVNGQEVGHNRGGHVSFTFEISPYLQEGRNRLTIRVEDRQDPQQPRGKQSSTGLPKGIDYYCTTGIWQAVWLEPVPPMRIEELRITPRVEDDAFDLSVILHAPSIGWHLEVEALDGGVVVASVQLESAGAATLMRLRIPDPKLWSPDAPHLYDLRVRLRREGRIVDEIESYAGLRSVSVRDGRVCLNEESIYLAMVLDQGFWPESGLAPPSDDALRADVEWVKAFGFNGVRKHQKIEDPRWLYWCDRLGLLVWGEMPNARAWSPEAEEMLMAEWERAIERDYNHPCIITWVPVNESMGFPGLGGGHPGQYAFLERIVAATRRLDSTRPVIDNDGWEHTDVTDIAAIHDYSHTGEALRRHWEQTRQTGAPPSHIWTGEVSLYVQGAQYHGQPIVLTEVGGFLTVPDLPTDQRDLVYDVYASFRTSDELLVKYQDLMEGLVDLPFIAGFCYTQLTDVEQELNGLLTYDRRPKIAPKKVAQTHHCLFPGVSR